MTPALEGVLPKSKTAIAHLCPRQVPDRRIRLRQSIVGLMTLALLMGSFHNVAAAYNNSGNECWWDNPPGDLYVSGQYSNQLDPTKIEYLPNYGNGIEAARVRWTDTPTKVHVLRDDSSINWFALYWAQDGNWGLTWYYCHFPWSMDHFDARVNTFYPETNDPTLAASVFTHEVGHALGMGHSSDPVAIMNDQANRYVYMYPAQDDINGLNAMYPY